MPCYRPLAAYRMPQKTASGKDLVRVLGSLYHFKKWFQNDRQIAVPDGQCVGCRLERSRQWATRLMHERKCWDQACFLTLTYDDNSVPNNGSLFKPHLRKFFNDLRGRLAYKDLSKIKFFAVGEYGEKKGRPHYHAIVFGQDFGIGECLYNQSASGSVSSSEGVGGSGVVRRSGFACVEEEPSRSGGRQFSSGFVSDLWRHGMHRISEVTFESAAYVARYSLKKVSGISSREHYHGRVPEFLSSSNGLGKTWFSEWAGETYPADQVVLERGEKAVEMMPPAYYDRLLEKVDPVLFGRVKEKRRELRVERDYHRSLYELYMKHEVKRFTVANTLKRSL